LICPGRQCQLRSRPPPSSGRATESTRFLSHPRRRPVIQPPPAWVCFQGMIFSFVLLAFSVSTHSTALDLRIKPILAFGLPSAANRGTVTACYSERCPEEVSTQRGSVKFFT